MTESDLCHDFPGDEILIDGLHAMQLHFWNNNVAIDIPVVRVMNTAHYLAAYMFATTCSGDQMEYDALAYDSLSRDKKLTRVAMIVLAAMLKRTDGFRARNCRNLILENREPDFDYGVTLYDRFLRSAEKRFAEEDFLIDTHAQIQQLVAQNQQLIAENTQLKYTITTMAKEKPQTIVYNYGTYNDIHDNPNSTIYAAPQDAAKNTLIPKEGDYTALVKWLEIEKSNGNDYYAEADFNRSQMCRNLLKIIGWEPNQDSLRKAQGR